VTVLTFDRRLRFYGNLRDKIDLPDSSPTGTLFAHQPQRMTKETKRAARPKAAIRRLEEHTEPFVTVAALAKYWAVSRKQIYKQIEAGTLTALKFGPRLLRIRTTEALRFEQDAKMTAVRRDEPGQPLRHVPRHGAGTGDGALAKRHPDVMLEKRVRSRR
jgi:excisionase family DNA binding protein